MKEAKYSAVGSSSTSSVEVVAGNLVTRIFSPKLPQHFNAGLVTVAVVSLMVVLQIRDSLKNGLFDDFKRMIHPLQAPEELDLPQHWNYSSHEFLPIRSDWDEQRVRWIEADPSLKLPEGARPRIMMVTGSSQDEGELYILSHLLLRAGKNKQDYSQMHEMELYYNMVNPDPEFSDWWVKLPVVRMLMLRHPEVEWIWWLDADAVITDMTFEPPFAKLDEYNLILYGEEGLVHDKLDPGGLSTGAFIIRNCQWSLDLLGAWAYTGTDSKREKAPDAKQKKKKKTNETMVHIIPGDDRSSLVALLTQDKKNPSGEQKWVPKVKLVEDSEYTLNGNWAMVAPKLEELSQDNRHGVPFVTHFEGCLPHPSEMPQFSRQESENFSSCVEQLQRAFDFAENQVYRELGLDRNKIGNSTEPFVWKDLSKEESTDNPFTILPIVSDWDRKRKTYLDSKPWTRTNQAVILSGSPPTPCEEREGAHLLVRGLKNKMDYSRVHGIRIFYNMAVIHTNLTGWWSKLPALKLMMINSLDVEWIWWTDSDAAFTSMNFDVPYDRYNGYNLVMWGEEDKVNLKKYNAINTGNMFLRNCQWSLDLLDRWAALANMTEQFIGSVLDRPPGWPTDDQSTLVYLLITEPEKWAPKVFYENDGTVVMSGEWQYWTNLFVDEYKMRSDKRPLVTHFAGCHPCKSEVGFDMCLERYDRAYNFADNQVLESYGLRHERLNSSHIIEDYQRDAQEWTHIEIGEMIGKTPEVDTIEEHEEVPTTKEGAGVVTEEERVDSTQEQEEKLPTSNEGQDTTEKTENVDPAKEQEVPTSNEEEQQAEPIQEQEVPTATEEEQKAEPTQEQESEQKVDPTKEEEFTTEEQKVNQSQEQEAEPTTEEEEFTTEERKPDQSQEQEEVPFTRDEDTTKMEEEFTESREEGNVDPTDQWKQADQTKEEEVIPTEEEKGEGSAEASENGNDNQETVETPVEVAVEPNNEEKVDRPEEFQFNNENPEEVETPREEEHKEEPTWEEEHKEEPTGEEEHKEEPTSEEVMGETTEERDAQPEEQSTQSQEEENKQTEERGASEEDFSTQAQEKPTTETDP